MIVWKITEQQADQVLTALGHRPFLEVNGLIGELLRQAQEQQKAAQAQESPYAGAQTQVFNRPFDAAESNRIGDALPREESQAVNGLDQRV